MVVHKLNYTWYDFNIDCRELAFKILGSGREFINVYGVPRGGVAIAVRLASILKLSLCEHPSNMFTLIVDDVVDTGKVREKYAMYKFASLHYKPWATRKPDFYVHTTQDWIVYPWEVNDESEYPG